MSNMLGIGATGLTAAQQSLNTIAHNIANVNTPGYSRQTTLQAANAPTPMGPGFVGTGVGVLGTERSVDEFLNTAFRNQQSIFNQNDTYATNIQFLEDYFYGTPGDISQCLGNFFNALQDLNNDPSSIFTRQVFISQGQILQTQFNQLSSQLNNEISDYNLQLDQMVQAVNTLTSQIATLNAEIALYQNSTFLTAPNDLYDLREQSLFDLAGYIGISTTTQQDNTINVFIGAGEALVLGQQANTLGTRPNTGDASLQDVTISNGQYTQAITSLISGGQIGGVLQVRDSIISAGLNQMGRIAISLAMAFNSEHAKGLDLNGNFGLNMFNDPNTYSAMQNRVFESVGNTGTAVLSVSIDPLIPLSSDIFTYSQASNIVPAGSLTTLSTNMLSLNGVTIPPTTVADDTVSTSDALASAIAIANAINSQSSSHLITATPQPNTLYLGTFTPGALVAGNFTINGINVISTGANEATLLQDINTLSSQTGVTAVGDGNLHITLVANDGRNIQLTETVASAGATFTYLNIAGVPLNVVQRANIKLVSDDDVPIVIGGNNPNGAGFTAGSVPVVYPGLSADDYELTYNGVLYTLTDTTTSTVVAQSTVPTISVNGFSIIVDSGSFVAGDSFTIKPTRAGAQNFAFNIIDPTTIAVAFPVSVEASLNNQGTGEILVSEIINTSGNPLPTTTVLGNAFAFPGKLTPPIQIEFITPTTYRVFNMSQGGQGVQIGPDQTYDPNALVNNVFPISSVVDKTPPGPNPTYVYDPGYRITLQGVPKIGDIFTINYNTNVNGDNRNGTNLINLQYDKLMQGGSATFQQSYAQYVGQIGSQASQAMVNRDASFSTFNVIQADRNEISAVNLDEEATNLLGYQQAYQAAAQIILIARNNFDVLMRMFV